MANSGKNKAVAQAIADLQHVDLAARCDLLGLPTPVDEVVRMRILGRDMVLDLQTLALTIKECGALPVLAIAFLEGRQHLPIINFRGRCGGGEGQEARTPRPTQRAPTAVQHSPVR